MDFSIFLGSKIGSTLSSQNFRVERRRRRSSVLNNNKNMDQPIAAFNPERFLFRVLTLTGICFLTFGSYFIYDIPSALADQLTAVILFYNSLLSFDIEWR